MADKNNLSTRTKVTVPPVYHKILSRRGIESIIESSSLNEVVCIVAPYGCGKTLAVISWLRGRQAAWLDLEAFDNSEEAVLAYLTSALLLFAGEQEDTEGVRTNPEYLEDPWGFLCKGVSQMERADQENILVIDNFRFIQDAKLLYLIKNFIAACLGHWRVIVMSRAELHPVFNDLMLKGHICLITLKDLSFNAEEISDYFIMNGCDVPQEDILRIQNKTEGWPAAINVVLTVSRGGPVEYGAAARSYVKDFFETEIWNGLDGKIKVFLLKTSVLEVLTTASCHAVTGIGATLPILNWLFLNGLFIARMNERNTYRYHSVFHDFLRDKLHFSDIDEKEINMKAAWWLYEKNEIEKSFPYFFKAGDLYGLSQVLRVVNPSSMGIEDFLDSMGHITELNIMDLKPYPVIVARMALIHYLQGDLDEMQALYQTFLEWIEPGVLPISSEEYAEYLWEAGWLSYLNPDEEVRNNTRHEEWTNYKEYVPHLKELHRARGAVVRFPSILRGIRDYCSTVDSVEMFLLYVEEAGQSPVREEVSLWETYLILAEYSYEIENFKKAEEIVRRIMTLTESEQMTDLYFVCTALLVRLLRALNMPKEIDFLTDRLEKMIINTKQYFLLPNFHAFQLRNRLADGKTGLTEVFAEENNRYAEKSHYYLLYRHVTLVRGLISMGNYNEALLILGSLDIICHKYKRIMDLMEINILKSVALYGLGREDGACLHLMEALREGKKYGYIRVFSDDAKDIWPILELARKQMKDNHIKNIIISCKKSLISGGYKFPTKQCTYAELTKTERKILKSLQLSMSYKEIALDNNIKISTVKSHVHSIYAKLDVDNRTSAIIAALDQGIIMPNEKV